MNLEKINDVAPHLTSPRRELMRGEEVFRVAGSEVSVHVFGEVLVNSKKIFLRALPVSPRYLKALPSTALCAGEGFREEALRLKSMKIKMQPLTCPIPKQGIGISLLAE